MRTLRKFLFCTLLLCFGAAGAAWAQPQELEEDFIGTILQEEQNTLFTNLSKGETPVTYMSLSVAEEHSCLLAAYMGSPIAPRPTYGRVLYVSIVVGDLDRSTNYYEGSNVSLPLYDENEPLIRNIIRSAVERAYKAARDEYLSLRIRDHFKAKSEDDVFTHPLQRVGYQPKQPDSFDPNACSNLLGQITAYIRDLSNGESEAKMDYECRRWWFVDSEGSYKVENDETADYSFVIRGWRPDGSYFKVDRHMEQVSPNLLPSENEWHNIVDSLILDFQGKMEKPTVSGDDYSEYKERLILSPYETHHDHAVETASDMFFRAVRDEVEETDLELQDKGLPVPYRSEFYWVDGRSLLAEARAGTLFWMEEKPSRTLDSRVLLGDNILNNEGVKVDFLWESKPVSLPADNNYDNFRMLLRRSLDASYRDAWQELEYKNAVMNSFDSWERIKRPRDGYREEQRFYDAEKKYKPVDKDKVVALVCELSAMLAQDTTIESYVNAEAYQAEVCYYSSDKVQYRQPFSVICIHLSAEIKTPDGGKFSDEDLVYVRDLEDLPDMAEWQNRMRLLSNRLKMMAAASYPTQYYDGPVLVEGEAVAQLFAHAFTENTSQSIYAFRIPLSKHIRHNLVGSRLERCVSQQVIAASCDVDALDTLGSYGGMRLIGQYNVDAEGVKVPPHMEIIHRGELYSLLSDRTPTLSSKTSNGHRRFAFSGDHLRTDVGPGVLRLTCHQTANTQNLKKMLCKKARAAGYHYAYIIRKFHSRNMSEYWSVEDFRPLYMVQVDVHTGKETPVRMFCAHDRHFYDFLNVSMATKELSAYNLMVDGSRHSGICPPLEGIPCSVIVPNMLLFDRMELLPIAR
ncbi:MAG: hypothetical protein IKQ75_03815 [Bacteroidales bacterium]|nr:hypothetical protein [Bacteroidales bacterium]